jgi:hypothetical protein
MHLRPEASSRRRRRAARRRGAAPCSRPLPARRAPLANAPQAAGRFSIRSKNATGLGKRSPGDAALEAQQSDYASKLLHLAWHPEANVIACAASNSLYMYCA